ncbi:MAG TPA: hypothetical protein VMP12_02450 [Candidatus Sulfotelmatobacter sp.]|nr:hypothetical protein [Candidatus Sulfotelmatobacter sp.]
MDIGVSHSTLANFSGPDEKNRLRVGRSPYKNHVTTQKTALNRVSA